MNVELGCFVSSRSQLTVPDGSDYTIALGGICWQISVTDDGEYQYHVVAPHHAGLRWTTILDSDVAEVGLINTRAVRSLGQRIATVAARDGWNDENILEAQLALTRVLNEHGEQHRRKHRVAR